MDSVDDILAHYGVKGQKWGVRKDNVPESVSVRAEPGRKIKTSGGRGHAPSNDAVNTAVIKRKAKASSTNSLTNQELQAAVKRMQLEQQFASLRTQSNAMGRGKNYIKELLGIGKTANEVVAFNNSPAGQELRSQMSRAKDKARGS